jgi:para-nitrobenzyl esterase
MTHNSFKRVSIAIILIFCTAAPLLAQIKTAKVTGGIVEGVLKDDIASFKGIPFAAPPMGDLRWRSPQPVIPWKGILKASEFGPSAMQDPGYFIRKGIRDQKISEDCLYLNVWTGAKKAGDKRPVMVWIYGGGFSYGTAGEPEFDGTNLAKRGVVLVSVAYRVGPMGFLAHPELSKESGKGSGAYGIQDQIAGLKWVKENIARFGGDPSKVTVFGCSAGGTAVAILAASPIAKGFFQRAICQSGTPTFSPVSLKMAEDQGMDYLSKLGANDIKTARLLSAEVIQKAYKTQSSGMGMFRPVADGETIVSAPYDLLEIGKFNDVPILIGTNSNEGASFGINNIPSAAFGIVVRTILTQAGFKEGADAVLRDYVHSTDIEATQSARDVVRDYNFAGPTLAWATLLAGKSKSSVFVYYFDHRTPLSPDGALHGAEVPYAFGNLDAIESNPNLAKLVAAGPIGPEDKALSELMTSYWVNFAKKRDPNSPGLPVWPAFDDKEYKTMVFDKTPSAREYPHLDKMKVFESYYSEKKTK